MRLAGFAAGLAALALSGCSSFIGGDLVREGEPVGQIVLVNQSGMNIDVVTISRCSAMSHGLDILDGNIPSGSQRAWTVNAGCWDVGAGRTGSCGSGGCSWNEAYIRVEVPANRSVAARFTPSS
jgi:hypothetical protein